MSKNTNLYTDVISTGSITTETMTRISKIFSTEGKNGEAFMLVDLTRSAGSTTVTIETADRALTAASVSASDAFTTGEYFDVAFEGSGWADTTNFKNILPTLPAVRVTVGADATVTGLNATLASTIVTTTGQYKNLPLSYWFEFASTTTFKLKDKWAASDKGFYVTNSGSAEITTGAYYGSEYTWTTIATTGSLTSSTNIIKTNLSGVRDYVRVKAANSGLTGSLSVKLALVSRDTKNSESSIDPNNYNNLISVASVATEVYTSKAIEVGNNNKTIELKSSYTGTPSGTTIKLQTTFGSNYPKTIYNTDNFGIGSPGAGKSSPHVSYYDDLSNAIWYDVAPADTLSQTITFTTCIGKYVRVVVSGLVTDTLTNLVVDAITYN